MFLALALALLDDSDIQLMARAWVATASGKVSAFDPPGPKTRVDLESDMGIEGFSPGWMLEIRHRIHEDIFMSLGYASVTLEGSTTLNKTLFYEGQMLSPGDRIKSQLDVRWGWLNFEYDVPFYFPYGWRGHLTPHLGARIYSPTVEIRDTTAGISEDDHFVPWSASGGMRLRLEPTYWLEIGAAFAAGTGPTIENTRPNFWEVQGEVRVVYEGWTAAVGYLVHSIDLEKRRHGDSDFKVRVHGAFFELAYRF